ncbi:MAG TPA: hypothetical protein VKV74_04230 [Bryobacteraceae bacterium]|nr:hypothetical protein [Bryobacteraceae bacterium]
MGQQVGLLFLTLALAACSSPEARLRRALANQATGVIRLPAGVIEISSELRTAPQAHDLEITGPRTVLKASDRFRGRAILSAEGAHRIRLHDFGVDGNRAALAQPFAMAPPENAFRVWYPTNGFLFDRVQGLEISRIHFANVVNFPILASRSSDIAISHIRVEDSGSRNRLGRNNLSGGVLIEEGSSRFEVRDSAFRRIAGNALWTHSLFTSPRLRNGVFANNEFDTIGRDAIQVGHASKIRVEDNRGSNIGYPVELVDVENGGSPVAIDTAGNVDFSVYARNRFEEVDGKCFDLDGFHDGQLLENRCVNRKRAEDYPFGHFGIVMNNTDPSVRSQNIEISGNIIDGAKFGGLFLMGGGHRIVNNQFLNLNAAGCNASAKRFGCIYKVDEPEMLESGIYLGRGVARLEETRGNVIRDNRISGRGMARRCIQAGPGVALGANRIERNQCWDSPR